MSSLALEPDLCVAGYAESGEQALSDLGLTPCDAILLDLSLPGVRGLELLERIRAAWPEVPVLVLSMHEESQYALRALHAGATGYLSKLAPPGTILQAIRRVLGGETYVSEQLGAHLTYRVLYPREGDNPLGVLTPREQEVIRMVGDGRSSQEIAQALNLSVKTVESHRLHLRDKLGFEDAGGLKRFAREWRAYTMRDGAAWS
jgi:DNA-binding NarL/FixJ family response regulator